MTARWPGAKRRREQERQALRAEAAVAAADALLVEMVEEMAGAAVAPVYSPSPINGRARRTRVEMERLREAIYQIVQRDQPMTVRQVFYALTVQHIIAKTEAEYNGTVVRLLTQMRRDGVIPYGWISDNTRWVRKPNTYSGLVHALQETARFYRRDLWHEAPVNVEVWCEKDALAGVIMEETDPYDVPLMVSRGFSSDTYLHEAAQAITALGKPAVIYQLGDHDPSGVWIARKIEEGLRRHAPDAEIHFHRVAVTPDQIRALELPTRPTKRKGNAHANGFAGASVELDAIPPLLLRALVRDCIARHVDRDKLAVLKAAEESERRLLTAIAGDIFRRSGRW